MFAPFIAALLVRASGAVADGVAAPVLRHAGAVQRATRLPRRTRAPARGPRGAAARRALLARPHGRVLLAVKHGGQGGGSGANHVVAGTGDLWKNTRHGIIDITMQSSFS